MKSAHQISSSHLSLSQINEILQGPISLSEENRSLIQKCRTYLDKRLEKGDELLYGINTGFGSLCNIRIEKKELQQLQENLVRSHACGAGEPVPPEVVKLMLLLKIQSLAYGHSGVRVETVERLIFFYNENLLPLVYQKGSLGASGDLAPLAHLCLPLIGEGHFYEGQSKRPAQEVLKSAGLKPLKLEAKEGLALLNGTQFMSAYGVYCLFEAQRLSAMADFTAALSADAFLCKTEPFLPYIHEIRPHRGQKETAKNILALLYDSPIAAAEKKQVQDPYSFRCIPQVHGAVKDAMAHVEKIFETEINSVTDNPNIFPDEDMILSGGNFHGEPLAIAMDYLAIALAELGSISERRIFQLLSGQRDLPEFLVARPGINSGLMIPQYTAAALVSENKQLCTPASIDTIPSSNGQEDHVSMGANAATKLFRVSRNLEYILAIEWLSATQALEFRRPLHSSAILEQLVSGYREKVHFIEKDRILHDDMESTVKFGREIDWNLHKLA